LGFNSQIFIAKTLEMPDLSPNGQKEAKLGLPKAPLSPVSLLTLYKLGWSLPTSYPIDRTRWGYGAKVYLTFQERPGPKWLGWARAPTGFQQS